MIDEVCNRLLGRKTAEPDFAEAQVWAEAATFFHGRIQASAEECPGRGADMSPAAAEAMRTVLASIPMPKPKVDAASWEAARMLMGNRERVVLDITNPGPKNIDGIALTQPELRRVDRRYRASVDTMISEVCYRLLGQKMWKPSTPEEMPGRSPDMSADAAAAMRQVLATL